jgi:hypothetical protein
MHVCRILLLVYHIRQRKLETDWSIRENIGTGRTEERLLIQISCDAPKEPRCSKVRRFSLILEGLFVLLADHYEECTARFNCGKVHINSHAEVADFLPSYCTSNAVDASGICCSLLIITLWKWTLATRGYWTAPCLCSIPTFQRVSHTAMSISRPVDYQPFLFEASLLPLCQCSLRHGRESSTRVLLRTNG